jgi:uncharacterized cupin superfamily protein
MSSADQVHASTLTPEKWEPFDAGEVRWLRRGVGPRRFPQSGVWRVTPAEVAPGHLTEFLHDETIYLIDGAVDIEPAGGGTLTLRAGDFASFDQGIAARWTIVAPSWIFFVHSTDASRAASDDARH